MLKVHSHIACICVECSEGMKPIEIIEKWEDGEACLYKCPKCGREVILELWIKSNYPLTFVRTEL